MKTSELQGAALDWAVAKCEGYIDDFNSWLHEATLSEVEDGHYKPSTNWAQGGPIIEREKIDLTNIGEDFRRSGFSDACHARTYTDKWVFNEYGPTPLIAAMRCYVASKLGEYVDVPEELV